MAASKPMMRLFANRDRYLKAYETFIVYSAKYEHQDTWTKTVLLDKIVPHLPNLDQDNELRVLGVGSGSGEVEFPFLTALLKKYPIITNRVVEPDKDQIIKYKALVQSKGHELQGVKFDWRQQTLEQYSDTDGVGTKFHLISAIHSLYHVEDVDSSLMYLYDLLEPGGIMISILLSDLCGMWKFWSRTSDLCKRGLLRCISSHDMLSSFDRHDIPYVLSRHTSEMEITKCFDETSEDGDLLLDFCLQVSEFKKTESATKYKEVIEHMASSECSKKDGSKILMSNDWEAVIVTKPSN
ncbi:histamine N-methyltransferase-like [Asterias amurensis]|uniref:histamine N-methyltransferase-like n=1 Tax=Asterias amurensis TaxID=7602 RepID=UPI003AB194DC